MATSIVKASAFLLFALSISGALAPAQDNSPQMTFHRAVAFGVSPPLRELAGLPGHPHYGLPEDEPLNRSDVYGIRGDHGESMPFLASRFIPVGFGMASA